MADVRISDLQSAAAQATHVVPVSSADGLATYKVTLGGIAALATSSGAVQSDSTTAGGGQEVTNIVVITEEEYNALSEDSIHPTTVYIVT